jgi:hypothetical protein
VKIRSFSVLLGVALVVPLSAPPASAADAKPGIAAGNWLVSQTSTNGNLLPGEFGPMYGPSIDAALSLHELGGYATEEAAITAALASGINSYVTGEAFGDPGSHYAGPLGKAIVLAQVQGQDPTNFGGENLINELEVLVATKTPLTGRIRDVSTFGDFANVIGQSFAARALTVAGSNKAASARKFLVAQQCPAGWFRESFSKKKAANQSCRVGKTSQPSVDATALAVLNMAPVKKTDKRYRQALGKAKTWLIAEQQADGSWEKNANSTGLATLALATLNNRSDVAQGARWLRSVQIRQVLGCFTLAANDGAIAYNPKAMQQGLKRDLSSVPAGVLQQYNVATAQAAAALKFAPTEVSGIKVRNTAEFVRAKSKQQIQIRGAIPGTLCAVKRVGKAIGLRADLDGTTKYRAIMPRATGSAEFVVSDVSGTSATASFQVLGVLRIPVRLTNADVTAGERQKVVATGLVAGEQVVVRLNGEVVKSGNANTNGRFTASWKVKSGTEDSVTVTGHFPDLRKRSVKYRIAP